MGLFMRENGKMMKNMDKEGLSVHQELFRLSIYYAKFIYYSLFILVLKGLYAKFQGIFHLKRSILDSLRYPLNL